MKQLLRRKIFLIPAVLILFSFLLACWFFLIPPSGIPPAKVLYVKKGMPLRQVGQLLQQEGIVRSKTFFILLATLLGEKALIKAGEYEFDSPMRPLRVLQTLVKGQVKRHLVTIPEGYTLDQTAQLLEDQKIVDREEFLQKASSPILIASLDLPVNGSRSTDTLEGYLFPETYHFYRGMDPEEVIRSMVNQFKKVNGPELTRETPRMGISENQAVILASIIEKETSVPEEKPLISAVFHNRLTRGMPLQSDPTVIYGIKNFNGNLTKEDLQRPTPYNTYVRTGLPPSPICNPGKDSLVAALHPAPVPYLYFVSKNDGSHHFSLEIEDHNRAVWNYQKNRKKNSLTKK
jgi:UPF0755 protein